MIYQQNPNMRVWSQGRDYVEAAEILLNYNRLQPAVVMAALALEIFVKSFMATRHRTGHATTKKGHDLSNMFKIIDAETQAEIIACSIEIEPSIDFLLELKKHDDAFVSIRYGHEPTEGTARISYGSDILYFARHICDAVFLLGGKRGV
jgi:HEPN domain-containing protein